MYAFVGKCMCSQLSVALDVSHAWTKDSKLKQLERNCGCMYVIYESIFIFMYVFICICVCECMHKYVHKILMLLQCIVSRRSCDILILIEIGRPPDLSTA